MTFLTARLTLLLVVSSAYFDSPQDITLDGFVSLTTEGAHFTHDDTVNDDEPVGREENDDTDVDTYDPFNRIRPELGNEVLSEK
jgi:hypothetical protein